MPFSGVVIGIESGCQAPILISCGGLGTLLPSSPIMVSINDSGRHFGRPQIARQAFFALRFRVLVIEALVTTAAIGAILIGEYWEAAVVTFPLFAFGSPL